MIKSGLGVAIFVSLVLHGGLIAVLVISWTPEIPSKHVVKPNYVKASLVELKDKAPKKQVKKKPKKVDLTKRREEVERKKKLELKKKQAAAQKKKKDAEKKKERERKKLAEAEAKARQQELLRIQQQLDEEMLAEDQLVAEEELDQLARSYVASITERIERNWSRPPSARTGMQCELLIQLVPTGQVVQVTIIKSSGNTAFDRSAEQAVKKVERFPEIKEMPAEVFERSYRKLTLIFNPKDLRQ